MSRIRADRYTNREGTGAPTFADGVNVVGISSLGITTVTGVGQTALTVNGDARITGVLTVGQGSVTIDGTSGNSSITGVTTAGIGSVYGVDSINDLGFPNAGPLSNRNLIINGAMTVAQRGTSFTSATGGTFVTDRWKYEKFAPAGAVHTIEQSTDAPAGFTYSIKATTTTTGTLPAGSFYQFLYHFEAQNISQIQYGTANAQTLTLSFWVKAKLAGTYPVSFQHPLGTRVYPATYTVNNADTWEYKTVTLAGDTGGTWTMTGNVAGLRLSFNWGMGSDYTGGTAGAWAAASSFLNLASTSGPDVNGTVGNYIQFAGVQLEVGSKATPFEHRSYGQELALCQRYYFERNITTVGFYATGASHTLHTSVGAPVTMRATPTTYPISGSTDVKCSVATAGATKTDIRLDVTSTETGQNYAIGGIIKATAEL